MKNLNEIVNHVDGFILSIINALPPGCPDRTAFAIFLAKRADAALMAVANPVQLTTFEEIRKGAGTDYPKTLPTITFTNAGEQASRQYPGQALLWNHVPSKPIGKVGPDGKPEFFPEFRKETVDPIILNLGVDPASVTDEQAAQVVTSKMMEALDAIVFAPPKESLMEIFPLNPDMDSQPAYKDFWRTVSAGTPLAAAARSLAAVDAINEASDKSFANAVAGSYRDDNKAAVSVPGGIKPGTTITIKEMYGGQIDLNNLYGTSRYSPGEGSDSSVAPPQMAQALKKCGMASPDVEIGMMPDGTVLATIEGKPATLNQVREYRGLEPVEGSGPIEAVKFPEGITVQQGETLSVSQKYTVHPDGSITSKAADAVVQVIPNEIDMTNMINREGWRQVAKEEFEKRYKRPGTVVDNKGAEFPGVVQVGKPVVRCHPLTDMVTKESGEQEEEPKPIIVEAPKE